MWGPGAPLPHHFSSDRGETKGRANLVTLYTKSRIPRSWALLPGTALWSYATGINIYEVDIICFPATLIEIHQNRNDYSL